MGLVDLAWEYMSCLAFNQYVHSTSGVTLAESTLRFVEVLKKQITAEGIPS